MNPRPPPGIIRTPCLKCGGEREHLGIGVCWDCMGPAERARLAWPQDNPPPYTPPDDEGLADPPDA